jgi:tetratricopeptide (TPR) repeat protein
VTQNLYEQYKEALRRGHVAALHGRLEAAASAYEAAAAIAPDRALPYTSLGGLLLRLGRPDGAEAAYAAALQRAPGDEAALRGRATLRSELGQHLAAARDFEALADTLEQSGRLPEACDAARRALELAESRARRRTLERLAAQLGTSSDDAAAAEALRLALQVLGSAGSPGAAPEAAPATGESVAEAPVESSMRAVSLADAEALLDLGDVAAARSALLALAQADRAAGRLDAALDACLLLIAVDPSDPALQLEIAAIQVARGWSAVAAEKLRLLGRLTAFEGDTESSAAIAAFATEHGLVLPDSNAGPESVAPA